MIKNLNERNFTIAMLAYSGLVYPNPETAYRSTLADKNDNNKIFDYFKDIWKKRNDRYSELRHSKKINKVNKIEMSYIGG